MNMENPRPFFAPVHVLKLKEETSRGDKGEARAHFGRFLGFTQGRIGCRVLRDGKMHHRHDVTFNEVEFEDGSAQARADSKSTFIPPDNQTISSDQRDQNADQNDVDNQNDLDVRNVNQIDDAPRRSSRLVAPEHKIHTPHSPQRWGLSARHVD